MDRFNNFKLGVASSSKREGSGVAWAASSCNAFAIATFSSLCKNYLQKSISKSIIIILSKIVSDTQSVKNFFYRGLPHIFTPEFILHWWVCDWKAQLDHPRRRGIIWHGLRSYILVVMAPDKWLMLSSSMPMRPDGFLFYAAYCSDAQFADVKNTVVT